MSVTKIFFTTRAKIAGLPLLWLVCAGLTYGQLTSLQPVQQPGADKTQSVVDPLRLGRETPRGTLLGFIRAAQNESEAQTLYFQPPSKGKRPSPAEEQELAAQLFTVLNAKFPVSAISSISNDPEGRGEDGVQHDTVVVGGTRLVSESFQITLVRLEDVHNLKRWFISRQTLVQVPEAYDSLHFPQLATRLPVPLVKYRLA